MDIYKWHKNSIGFISDDGYRAITHRSILSGIVTISMSDSDDFKSVPMSSQRMTISPSSE